MERDTAYYFDPSMLRISTIKCILCFFSTFSGRMNGLIRCYRVRISLLSVNTSYVNKQL